jgi:hypothetical protein
MARKLKTYQTSLGFYDLAIAAPSMKAALDAWGADSNLFRQGAAKQSDDPDVIAATMAVPGIVLKRPIGSSGTFKENAELPTDLAGDANSNKAGRKSPSRKPQNIRSEPPTTRPTGRPHSLSRRRKSVAIVNARRKRLLGARSASDGSVPSTKRKTP